MIAKLIKLKDRPKKIIWILKCCKWKWALLILRKSSCCPPKCRGWIRESFLTFSSRLSWFATWIRNPRAESLAKTPSPPIPSTSANANRTAINHANFRQVINKIKEWNSFLMKERTCLADSNSASLSSTSLFLRCSACLVPARIANEWRHPISTQTFYFFFK